MGDSCVCSDSVLSTAGLSSPFSTGPNLASSSGIDLMPCLSPNCSGETGMAGDSGDSARECASAYPATEDLGDELYSSEGPDGELDLAAAAADKGLSPSSAGGDVSKRQTGSAN